MLRDTTFDKSFYELENEKMMSCPAHPRRPEVFEARVFVQGLKQAWSNLSWGLFAATASKRGNKTQMTRMKNTKQVTKYLPQSKCRLWDSAITILRPLPWKTQFSLGRKGEKGWKFTCQQTKGRGRNSPGMLWHGAVHCLLRATHHSYLCYKTL